MGFATLPEFTLHLSRWDHERRIEMAQVKVLRTRSGERSSLHLIGSVKAEVFNVAPCDNMNVVFKTERKKEREAIIRLLARGGEILAFEGDNLIGFVVWDDSTRARKLPNFMRRLLGVSP